MRRMPDHAEDHQGKSYCTSARQLGAETGSYNVSHHNRIELREHGHGTPSNSLTGPAEIPDKGRVRLLNRLDATDQPFKVRIVPLSRKRKRGDTKLQIQDDLLEARLAIQYRVGPKEFWESLRRYKKFTAVSRTGKRGFWRCVHSTRSMYTFASVGLIDLKTWRIDARIIMARMSSCPRIRWMSSTHKL
jgi:hypothetical protein